MIISSFQAQYGMRLSNELRTMSWREFSYLLSGLSGDSPLGRIISIRAENDPEKLKEFTPEQRKIRNKYLTRQAQHKTPQQTEEALENIKKAFIGMTR